MNQQDKNSENFIRSIRREMRWSAPILMVASIILLGCALFIDAHVLSRLGAGLLGMGCAWGSIVSRRNAQASEAKLLEHVSKIHGAAYGVLALGMCLWSMGGEGNWVIMLSIIVLSILGESKRRNMARERLGRV